MYSPAGEVCGKRLPTSPQTDATVSPRLSTTTGAVARVVKLRGHWLSQLPSTQTSPANNSASLAL
eukprot:4125781-Lingulodinium_polyedra.AAC.1